MRKRTTRVLALATGAVLLVAGCGRGGPGNQQGHPDQEHPAAPDRPGQHLQQRFHPGPTPFAVPDRVPGGAVKTG